jgi:hypothetical protein
MPDFERDRSRFQFRGRIEDIRQLVREYSKGRQVTGIQQYSLIHEGIAFLLVNIGMHQVGRDNLEALKYAGLALVFDAVGQKVAERYIRINDPSLEE